MAINKAVGKPAKSHGGLRNTIEYVLKDEKVREGYLDVTGPFSEQDITYDAVYRTWLEEKRIWDKDSGRMCAHNVFTNNLCRERGLHVAEKGRHFDGSLIEAGEIIAWNKNTYKLLTNDSKKSFLADCGIALMEVIPKSASKEEFISGMAEKGWSRRKRIFSRTHPSRLREILCRS